MANGTELPQITVRGAGGKTARVRVVEETTETYYVTSEAEYRRARQAGEDVQARLGFPKADVVPD